MTSGPHDVQRDRIRARFAVLRPRPSDRTWPTGPRPRCSRLVAEEGRAQRRPVCRPSAPRRLRVGERCGQRQPAPRTDDPLRVPFHHVDTVLGLAGRRRSDRPRSAIGGRDSSLGGHLMFDHGSSIPCVPTWGPSRDDHVYSAAAVHDLCSPASGAAPGRNMLGDDATVRRGDGVQRRHRTPTPGLRWRQPVRHERWGRVRQLVRGVVKAARCG